MLWLFFQMLFHFVVEIDSICNSQDMAGTVKHFNSLFFAERLKSLLIFLELNFALFLCIDMISDFLDNVVKLMNLVLFEVIVEAYRYAGKLWSISQYCLDNWLTEEFDIQFIEQ